MKIIYSILAIFALTVSTFFLFNNVSSTNESAEAETEIEEEIPKNDTLIPVLMYHHFVEVGEETSPTTITDEAFEEQMKYLKSLGYNTITEKDIIDFYYNGQELPENPIHITIDDGYESNYELAYPILKENEMKATIFIIGSRIDGEYSLPRLSWEQVKEMSDSGVVNIQSHTYDLHHKEDIYGEKVSAMIAYDTEEHHRKIIDDLILSKQLIEYKLGKEVLSLAFPYGHYDENTLSAVEEAGFKLAYTVKHGLNEADTNPIELHRINVTSEFDGKKIEEEIMKLKELIDLENSEVANSENAK